MKPSLGPEKEAIFLIMIQFNLQVIDYSGVNHQGFRNELNSGPILKGISLVTEKLKKQITIIQCERY